MSNKGIQKAQVTVLNREFAVACAPSEREALLRAAKQLDATLRRLRSQSHTSSAFDQLLVVAALNLCAENSQLQVALNQQPDTPEQSNEDRARIQKMIGAIDQLLDNPQSESSR